MFERLREAIVTAAQPPVFVGEVTTRPKKKVYPGNRSTIGVTRETRAKLVSMQRVILDEHGISRRESFSSVIERLISNQEQGAKK